MIISDRRDQLPRLLAALTVLAGTAAWIVYLRAGLVLSHYDAKAHLVVARRIFDSLTPGWQQVGAVWLPLPHLLNMLPAQVDVLYRTGAAGSIISILCFGLIAYASARLVLAVTGSSAGATTAVAVLALNPNLLYLQSTPMTEPLLLALTSLVVLWMYAWVLADREDVPARLGWVMVAATLTRYEAWPVVGAAVAAATYATWRRGSPPGATIRRGARLAAWPLAAVAAFLVNSRITVGSWFVSEGFYVPDPAYQGLASRTLISVWWGTHQLSGYVVTTVALVTAGLLIGRALLRKRDSALLLPVASLAAAALPLVAFYAGHPYRIRYMVPLVAAAAMLNGIAVGLAARRERRPAFLRRAAPLCAAAVVASALIESPPWKQTAPMLVEAQWDRPASAGRRRVTACLAPQYHGEKVLASMGSLAHYMQELSGSGFQIADFIHEGNGPIWNLALDSGAAIHAGWMLVEEGAEGGDVLASRIERDSNFTSGMTRVCEGGGVALYRRTAEATNRGD